MSETVTMRTPSGGEFNIRKARGAIHGSQRKIAVGFSADDFEAISMKAVMEGRSFNQQVRHYVELGRKVDARRG